LDFFKEKLTIIHVFKAAEILLLARSRHLYNYRKVEYYYFHCILFKFFNGHFACLYPRVINFKTGFLQFDHLVFKLKFKPFREEFGSTNIMLLMWLQLNMFHKLYLNTPNFVFTHFYVVSDLTYCRFYYFVINLILNKKIFFNFKTHRGAIGMWPKMFFKSSPLFDISDVEIYEYNNNKLYFFEKNKKQRIKNFTKIIFFLKNLSKKKFLSKLMFKYNGIYFINYKINNFVKFFSKLCNFTIFFLRKQKCFNKGRYSRNRQIYRTGVYWCLYVNIIALVGLNFLFYKFTIHFSYYWWVLYFFFNLYFLPQILKINFNFNFDYLPSTFFNKKLVNTLNYFFFYKNILNFWKFFLI